MGHDRCYIWLKRWGFSGCYILSVAECLDLVPFGGSIKVFFHYVSHDLPMPGYIRPRMYYARIIGVFFI